MVDTQSGFGTSLSWRLPIAALLVGLIGPLPPGTAQTRYTYTADTDQPVARKGAVMAGALQWDCQERRCTIAGFWPSLGAKSCQALARSVGPIKSFGRPGAELDATQLRECNATPVVVPRARGVADPGWRCADCDGDGHATNEGPPIYGPMDPDTGSRRAIGGAGVGDDCDDADPNRYPGNTETVTRLATTRTAI
jgi:hypothetical protein